MHTFSRWWHVFNYEQPPRSGRIESWQERDGVPGPITIAVGHDLFKDYIWSGEREATMSLSDRIKPISYLKAHAAEIVRTLGDGGEPLIVTQNGEAKVVIQDIDSYEEMQETLALLKILALGRREVEAGKIRPAADVIAEFRERDQG